MCCGEERWTKGEGSSGGCMTRQQVASTMKTVERGDTGSGSPSVNVLGVKWVSLVVSVGQAGVCTVIYPLLGLGPGGRVLMRLGLC